MASRIPAYALYGDQAAPDWLDTVHIEQIHERSSLFHYEIAPHVHQGLLQLLYITQGGGEVFIDGRQWSVTPPALVVIPAQHVHGFHFKPQVDGPVVTAAQQPLESLAAVAAPALLRHIREPQVLDVSVAARHAQALAPLFEAIAREHRVQAKGESAAGMALLLAVFVQVARVAAAQQLADAPDSAGRNSKAARVERFRALVDAQFRHRWPVGRYAASLGLSAGQLSRLCRELLGQSALDVVNARILHEAQRELVYATLSVKQIATVLGFADEAYFGRFFRKHAGRTPTEYRDAARRQLGRGQPAATAGAAPPAAPSGTRAGTAPTAPPRSRP